MKYRVAMTFKYPKSKVWRSRLYDKIQDCYEVCAVIDDMMMLQDATSMWIEAVR